MRRASAAGNSNSRVRVGPQTSCCPWLRFLDLRTRREPDLAYEIACEPPSTQSEPIGLSRYRNLSLAAFKAVMPARCQQAAGPQYKSASTVRSLAEAKTQANRWNELPVLHASVHCPESIKPMIARKGQQPAIPRPAQPICWTRWTSDGSGKSTANRCGTVSCRSSNLHDVNVVADDRCCRRVRYPTASRFRKPPCVTTGVDRLRV